MYFDMIIILSNNLDWRIYLVYLEYILLSSLRIERKILDLCFSFFFMILDSVTLYLSFIYTYIFEKEKEKICNSMLIIQLYNIW